MATIAVSDTGLSFAGITDAAIGLIPRNQAFSDTGLWGTGGGGPTVVNYYKMRALADPGPGYLTWVATGAPDFTGTGAGGPIQAGSAVVADQWSI